MGFVLYGSFCFYLFVVIFILGCRFLCLWFLKGGRAIMAPSGVREDVVFYFVEGFCRQSSFVFCFVVICLATNHQCLAIVRKILRGI